MLEITFIDPKGKVRRKIQAEPGEILRTAAIRNTFSIYPHIKKILNCRGRGLCNSCTVEIVSGEVAQRNAIENDKLKSNTSASARLACQLAVTDNLVVKTQSGI